MPQNHRSESTLDAGTATQINLARSVAPHDTSTSIVITPPAGPQIKTGKVGVTTYSDLVYATRAGADGNNRVLCLDLVIPQTPGAKPLVVYVPGGGFVVCQKEMALERRTFVAEAGYAAFVLGPGTDRSLADEPAVVAAANPAQYVTAMTPPFLLFHGSADNAVSPSQTLTLHNVLRKHGVESTRYLLTGAGHGDIALALAGLEDQLPPRVAVDDLVAMVGGIEGALPWTTRELLGYVIKFLAERGAPGWCYDVGRAQRTSGGRVSRRTSDAPYSSTTPPGTTVLSSDLSHMCRVGIAV